MIFIGEPLITRSRSQPISIAIYYSQNIKDCQAKNICWPNVPFDEDRPCNHSSWDGIPELAFGRVIVQHPGILKIPGCEQLER